MTSAHPGTPGRPRRPHRRPLGDLVPLLVEPRVLGTAGTVGAAGAAGTVGGTEGAAEGRSVLDGVTVSGITHDSRAVQPGDLYAALPGSHAHGASFAGAAAAAGAVAVLTDPAGLELARAAGLPVLCVPSPRAQLGAIASWVYGDPTRALTLLGVTGTNGKTTLAYLAEAGLRAAGHTTGLLGTVETRIAGRSVPSVRTTPEATDLQALFASMVEDGVTAAAMEVSSHALALHRVDGAAFAAAAFTNLSQDHLDFHPTMEDYFAAKASLFTRERIGEGAGRAVVGTDDAWGRRLAEATPGAVTYAVGRPADWRVGAVDLGPTGSSCQITGPHGEDGLLRVHLPGTFNLRNALGAVALLVAAGVDLEAALAGVAGLAGVPGRMETVDGGQPFLALVDYAHTPDAVTTVLRAVRGLVSGRVTVVLGCGGERDRGKRPLMGKAAAVGADLAVLTSDNPRGEDPVAILDQMSAGAAAVPAADRAEIVVEPDRAAAIALAVGRARGGDAVVVAGKGHESGQERDGVVTPFDDREVLRTALRALGSPA